MGGNKTKKVPVPRKLCVNFPKGPQVADKGTFVVADATYVRVITKKIGVFITLNRLTRCVVSYAVFWLDLDAHTVSECFHDCGADENSPTVEIIHVYQHRVYDAEVVTDTLEVYGIKMSQGGTHANQEIESFHHVFKSCLVRFYIEPFTLEVVLKRYVPKKDIKTGGRFKSVGLLSALASVRAHVFKQRAFLATLEKYTAMAVAFLNKKHMQETEASRFTALRSLKLLEDQDMLTLVRTNDNLVHLRKALLKTQVESMHRKIHKGVKGPVTEVIDLGMEDLVNVLNTPEGNTRLLLSLKQDVLESRASLEGESERVKGTLETTLREKDKQLTLQEEQLREKEEAVEKLRSRLASVQES